MSYINNSNFAKAVNFVYNNIDKPLTLDDIAKDASISVATLKRLFQETTNESVGAFIRKMRMELAFRSLQSKNESVLEIALAAGFDDHSAFSRRFKETFGYSPSIARQKLNIVNELESISLEEPDIVELTNLDIQSVTETGLYFECAPKAWGNLKQKLNADELSDDFSGLFIGIGHDNPHDGQVEANKVRFTAGVTLVDRNLGLNQMTLSAGLYARFRYFGKPANLGLAYHYIFGKWLQNSEFKINNSCYANKHNLIKSWLVLILWCELDEK
jgi:AraC-like DNA-binding protein/DNA gyrase inhibitor GyrI